MSALRCGAVREAFSAYLDGAISGREMQAMASHLSGCAACTLEFADWRAMQEMVGALGPAKAPADLGRKLRLASSREQIRQRKLRDQVEVRWNNLVQPMLVQVSAGLAATMLLVGGVAMLLGSVGAPAVLANDEPLGAITAPHYLYSAGPARDIQTAEDTTIVVEAQVNEEGQVYDYRVVSGAVDETTRLQLMDRLMLEVFDPARVFGIAARGQVVQTFAGVSVRG